MLEAPCELLGTGFEGSVGFDKPASAGASFDSTFGLEAAVCSSGGGFVLARFDCRNGPME